MEAQQQIDNSHQPIQEPVQTIQKPSFIQFLSKFKLIGVIILIVVSVFGSTYYFLNKKSSNILTSLPPSPTITYPSPAPDPTANWKTYINTKGNYMVLYPPDWNTSESQDTSSVTFRKLYPEVGPHADHIISVVIHENIEKLSLDAWIHKYVINQAQFPKEVKREKIVINGSAVDAISGAQLPAAYDSLHVYMLMNDSIVEFTLDKYSIGQKEDDFSKEGKNIFLQILSTFKFTDKGQMETLNISPCDVNTDGQCNTKDSDLIKQAFGKKRGDIGYHPFADMNLDGIIDINDLQLFFPVTVPKSNGE